MSSRIVQRSRAYKIDPNHMVRFLYNTITREEKEYISKRIKKELLGE